VSNPEDPTLPVEPPSVPPTPPPVPPYVTPPPPPYGAGGPPEPPFVPPPPTTRPTGLIVGLGVAVIALAAVAFFVGRSTVKRGPKTLLAAFTQAQQGKLPCGAPAPGGPAVGGNGGPGGAPGGGGGGGAGARGFGGGAFLGRICNGGANGGANGGNGGGNGGANGGAAGGGGRFGGGAGGLGALFGGPGATTGTVVSVNGDQLTIQTRAGNLTITLPAGVNITKTTAGAVGDLTNGETIIVTSATDASGKRTAQRIFILPAGTAAPGSTPPSTATG
jgi:hypothetical protein